MKIMLEAEAEDFLEENGFNVAKRAVVESKNELLKIAKKFGFPLVLKNAELLHKTEKDAVKLNVYESNLVKAYNELKAKKVLVHKQIDGNYFLVGVKKDPTFGHVIVFGLGGIYTELFNDVTIRVCPIDKKQAKDMLENIKFKKIYEFRNKKVNKQALVEALLKTNNLVKKYPNIVELDINPLIANQKEAIVADARIVFE